MADAGTITGRCLCGAIRYEFHGKPEWVVHCHCESCRRQVSSPLATVVGVLKENFRFTAGTPKAFASSPGVARSFCGNCGSPIAYEAVRLPDEIHLCHGTLDEPGALAPTAHVRTEEQLPWFECTTSCRATRRAGAAQRRSATVRNGRNDDWPALACPPNIAS